MEAYLNELSVKAFSNNKDAQDAFSLLGRCLSKMSELGVSNVRMTNEAMGKGMLPGQTWNRILNNETVIDKDLKSVLIAKLCTLEPVDSLEYVVKLSIYGIFGIIFRCKYNTQIACYKLSIYIMASP